MIEICWKSEILKIEIQFDWIKYLEWMKTGENKKKIKQNIEICRKRINWNKIFDIGYLRQFCEIILKFSEYFMKFVCYFENCFCIFSVEQNLKNIFGEKVIRDFFYA